MNQNQRSEMSTTNNKDEFLTMLKGKPVADKIKADVKKFVDELWSYGEKMKLVVVQVGHDEASNSYIKNKERACKQVGIESFTYHMHSDVTQHELEFLISVLNQDEHVNGILVQLPLPPHLDQQQILSRISPSKDVDGFTTANIGNAMVGNNSIIPCTAQGIIDMLDYYDVDVEGKNCVVVGRSNIVGKPVAKLLLDKNATVTICHSYTQDLAQICKNADILVCAIGKPKFFTKDYVGFASTVIDVGIHKMEDGKFCGDVDFDDVKDNVAAITPVPGGCGPLTVAELMANCVKCYKRQHASWCELKGLM